ncbi:MAG: 4-alpha-glucanotransferase [Lachnospiraceae bacterium]|nr:4-alpha-glucanotransferase [Lachnospiraceae bacterium]
MRKSGILMPVSSLPSKYGIGTFGKAAYEFVDQLHKGGQSLWQILPLGPTSYGDSPYQSFSTFAGNPYFIDLEKLTEDGLLTKKECDACDFGENPLYVDYGRIYESRFALLKKAFARFDAKKEEGYDVFFEENAFWLEDYALFMAVKNSFDGVSFEEWDDDIRKRKPEAMQKYKKQYQSEIDFYVFLQYEFSKQWSALKAYANDKGIQIVGDIPIYVAFDSSDTWASPELFQFDSDLKPIAVAGCPPDAFSATGQLWGNPLYNWEYHKETGYAWWMKRFKHCFRMYDIVRIDHFRGFDEYYSIPYGSETAQNGEWQKGPGYELFDVMKKTLGRQNVIAEDLGFLTPSVYKLVKKTGFPGMKILQFAFDSREESDYLPHNYSANSIVYTGTHDNDTLLGWWESLSRKDKAFAKKYMNIRRDKDVTWTFIRACMASVSDTAIIPMQDYLELGKEARINTPSTLGENWKWRMAADAFTDELAERISEMSRLYYRNV